MSFKPIDISNWKRREHFEHYLNQVPCSYSMTLNLDLTELLKEIKKRKAKVYPTMIYLISRMVNSHEEFRTTVNKDLGVGIFDLLHPSYTIFQNSSETFTNIWTEYNQSFFEFCKQYEIDVNKYSATKGFTGKPNTPPNVFTISCIPWISFTGFNLILPKSADYLLPIFTIGKYFYENDKIWLPIAVQVHHAVCDGFHLGKFLNELQEAMSKMFQESP